MIKKVMMTAMLTATMAVSIQAQDSDNYNVDATTGATEQKHDFTTGTTKCCEKNVKQQQQDTIWYNDMSYSKQNKEVSMKRNIYSSSKIGTADYLRDMDDIASFVSAHQGAKVTIIGYTTTTTAKGKNNRSTTTKHNSAESFKKALMARGVSESDIIVDAKAESAKAENGIYKTGIVTATATETADVPVMIKKYKLVQKPQSVEQSPTVKRVSKFMNAVSRLHVGGYAEMVMSRMFYSDHPNRYSDPSTYKDYPDHGRFDIPHVCLNIGYDFGKGWSFGSEIEFEHGGTESAVEMDADETGEYEAETEKGGEVALEQAWINKEFWKGIFNVKAGEIIVPVGLTNAHHEPLEFFTCYRNEGENTLFPCTWHQVGVSLWGRYKWLRYEAEFLSGLNSDQFGSQNFIHYGANSPYEFKVANSYAGALRLDFYVVKGLRLGLSGYYGTSFINALNRSTAVKYDNVKGAVAIGAFDFSYEGGGLIARGNIDYSHLSDADMITAYNKNYASHSQQDGSPSKHQIVGSNAFASGIEVGYNIFYPMHKAKLKKQALIPFVHYEYYNSMAAGTYSNIYEWCGKHRLALGLNYKPIKQIVVKAEWSKRFYKQQYNDEPSISLGIAYQGWFL